MSCNIQGLEPPCPTNIHGVGGNIFLALINTLLASQCLLGRKDAYPPDCSQNIQQGDEFDFIVVGAGSAGSVVASRLTEKGHKVLLLEAGDYPSPTSDIPSLLFSLQNTPEDWSYKTEPSNTSCLSIKDGSCRWPRGKALGGSSTINCNLYIRGNKRDYDRWAAMGNEEWTFDNVITHFQMSEKLQASDLDDIESYGRTGSLPLTKYECDEHIRKSILDAAKEMGYNTFKEEVPLGFFDSLMTIDDGVRANAAKSFLGRCKEMQNLCLVPKAHVKKIIIDPSTKEAKGVEVDINGETKTFYASLEVIISAGAIASPQLLMLSGIGPKNHLEELNIEVIEDLRVGENLQDHLIFPHIHAKLNKFSNKIVKPHELLDELYKYFMYRAGPVGQVRLTNLMGFINTKSNSVYPNVQFMFLLSPRGDVLLPQVYHLGGFEDAITKPLLELNENHNLLSFFVTLLNPKSTGKILLKSTDPYEHPIIHSGYLTDTEGEDIETLLEGVRFVERMTKTDALRRLDAEIVKVEIPNCKEFEFQSDEYWLCAFRNLATTVYHPVGTCKMGPRSDPQAIVNSRLQVHGVKKLRVIDASIMPTITSGNPNAPTIMIGQMGAGMILEDHTPRHTEL